MDFGQSLPICSLDAFEQCLGNPGVFVKNTDLRQGFREHPVVALIQITPSNLQSLVSLDQVALASNLVASPLLVHEITASDGRRSLLVIWVSIGDPFESHEFTIDLIPRPTLGGSDDMHPRHAVTVPRNHPESAISCTYLGGQVDPSDPFHFLLPVVEGSDSYNVHVYFSSEGKFLKATRQASP